MKTSVIRHRVADFLKQFPPFDEAPFAELMDLAGAGRVQFMESETYVYWRSKPWPDRVWVIQQGAVELLDEAAGEDRRIDLLGSGDCLGLERYLGDKVAATAARTASDVILYSFEARAFDDFRVRNPRVSRFIAAHSASHTAAEPHTVSGEPSWLGRHLPPIEYLRSKAAERPERELPVLPIGAAAGECFAAMLVNGTDSVLIASDGEHAQLGAAELSLVTGWNPVLLSREIAGANDQSLRHLAGCAEAQLAAAVASPEDVRLGAVLGTRLSIALADVLIREATRAVVPGEADACWVMLGRAGRGELLSIEAPALAVICPDTMSDTGIKQRRAALDQVARGLAACGIPASIDGSDEFGLCLRLSEWKNFFGRLIADPIGAEAYRHRALLDMSHLAGNPGLLPELQRFVHQAMAASRSFLPLLANDTQDHLPPLTFYEGLVVDLDGREKSSVDLFEKALRPVADAARVIAMSAGQLNVTNTSDRLKLAAPRNPKVLTAAVSAFETVAYFECVERRRRPLEAGHVDPSQMSRFDQRLLKTAFGSIQVLLEETAGLLS